MQASNGRAAVLCFGGWGLQTLLHLWPRIDFIQEQRRALGIDADLPDLHRLTSFVAILPELVNASDNGHLRPFRIVRPDRDRLPEPFYVEAQLKAFQAASQSAGPVHDETFRYTHAETWGQHLLDDALNVRGHLREVPIRWTGVASPRVEGRLARGQAFKQNIDWVGAAVRAILRYAIEPTRLDEIQPRDPFVRTTVYVVASLAEPATSTLIWPFLAELRAALTSQHVMSTIGLFNTASFAPDDTFFVEEAAAHTAFTELAALLDAGDATRHAAIEQLAAESGGQRWRDRVGEALFSRVYLLDREKVNQALVRDAFELSILAGNAIESFLSTNCLDEIERQLGPSFGAQRTLPYAALGAASDYVPLREYIELVVREEQKRIVRENVLRAPAAIAPATLAELGVTLDQAVRALWRPGVGQVFESPGAVVGGARQAARWGGRLLRPLARAIPRRWRRVPPTEDEGRPQLPEVRVSGRYLLPPPIAERLREAHYLWEWRQLVEARIDEVVAALPGDIQTEHFEQVWGTNYQVDLAEDELAHPAGTIARYQERTWAQRTEVDDRVIPAALLRAVRSSVTSLSEHPSGLRVAQERLRGWVEAVDGVLAELRQSGGVAAAHTDDQQLRRWERRFLRIAERAPDREATLARSLLLGFLLNFVALSWLLLRFEAALTWWQTVGAVAGCVVATALMVALPLGFQAAQVWWLKRQRLALARAVLSREANRLVRTSIGNVYHRLQENLREIRSEIDGPARALELWAKPEETFHIPPLGIDKSYLRIPHTTEEIREQVTLLIQQLASEQRFLEAWQRDATESPIWDTQGVGLVQRLRLALERPLNEREMALLLELESRRRTGAAADDREVAGAGGTGPHAADDTETVDPPMATPPPIRGNDLAAVRDDLAQDLWCGFRSGEGDSVAEQCTACRWASGNRCPFSSDGRRRISDWSLEAIVREYAAKATNHLRPPRGVLPEGLALDEDVVRVLTLERLLFPEDAECAATQARRDFVDEAVARAKPSANYEPGLETTQPVELGFAVIQQRSRVGLAASLADRTLTVLGSRDPTSVIAVRIVGHLAPDDLLLISRNLAHYQRLNSHDREQLNLFATLDQGDRFYDPHNDDRGGYGRILD